VVIGSSPNKLNCIIVESANAAMKCWGCRGSNWTATTVLLLSRPYSSALHLILNKLEEERTYTLVDPCVSTQNEI
jgi:hypothetical protein